MPRMALTNARRNAEKVRANDILFLGGDGDLSYRDSNQCQKGELVLRLVGYRRNHVARLRHRSGNDRSGDS